MTIRDLKDVERILGSRQRVLPTRLEDFDKIEVPGSDAYSSPAAARPVFTPLEVRRPFPLAYIETTVYLRANETASMALYICENRLASIPRTYFSGRGYTLYADQQLTLRRMMNIPIGNFTATSGSPLNSYFGHRLQSDVTLYPDRWYYIGFALSAGPSSAYYGFQTTDNRRLRGLSAAPMTSYNSWPDTLQASQATNSADRPPAFSAFTRRGILRYYGG